MTTITHRELRNNSAEILRRVAAGESFEVSNHGVVVAHLTPVGAPSYRLPFPVSRPATRVGGWDQLPKHDWGGKTTQQIIDEEREERI